ncbi:AraC family transcriptional regulator [Paenibacillus sp. P25]|nr:AraC family transcriptional regulator [Paenibacillus sp. P25]
MNKDNLLEERVHGDAEFPLGVYQVAERYGGEMIFNYHWHHEMELLYMKDGEAEIQIGSDRVRLFAGEAAMIPSGELHAAFPSEGRPFCMYAAVFDPVLLSSSTGDAVQRRYIGPLQERRLVPPLHFRGTEPWENRLIGHLRDLIERYMNRTPAYELRIKADLYLIFSELFEGGTMVSAEPYEPSDHGKIDRVKRVLRHIHDHYDTEIRVPELAALLNMSEGHFCRFFKSVVRKTPVEYINSVRVDQAVKRLERSDRKIIDIALEVGFDSPSYFIKTFKRLKHCTPSEFRGRNTPSS